MLTLKQTQQWLSRIYYYIRVLSIDIVLGAVSVSLFTSHLFNSNIPKIFWFLLPSVVWLIYTFDHITDGLSIKASIQKPTYRFHLRYKSKLIPIAIIIFITVIILFFAYSNKSLLIIALVGGGWIGIYFLSHKILSVKFRHWFPKELFISVGYIVGTFGLPYLTRRNTTTRIDILITTAFFLLVLINVLIYSYFDFEEDKEFKFTGIIQILGKKTGRKIILSLTIICNLLCSYLLFCRLNTVIIFMMSLGMSFIVYNPKIFTKNQLYGKVADALFLLPGLIIII